MYLKLLYPFVLLFVTLQLCAQNERNTFVSYAKFIAKNLDIVWKEPKGFIDLKTSSYWGVGKGVGIYRSVLCSEDEQCIIMYPNLAFLVGEKAVWKGEDLSRRFMAFEIKKALELFDKQDDTSMQQMPSLDKYVKVLIDKDAKRLFNADTVFIAQIPLYKTYKEKYTYCTGIYVCKKGRPPMFFKCFFQEDGKRNEERYLKRLFNAVHYRNENWIYDAEKYQIENYKLYLETGVVC